MKRVIVFGGYGTFGSQVAQELAQRGVPLTMAGRDQARAEAYARILGRNCAAASADVNCIESCQAALAGHEVAVNCAGPFHDLGPALLEACLDGGCHYVDIADDRTYASLVRAYGERFRARGLAAVYGCSSLPGISGALALAARDGATSTVDRARVTLFIGNANPKGPAAVQSLLATLGRPIVAAQGTLCGFGDREVVLLPAPFGRRAVFNFDSPEYDLFPSLLGARDVAVKVGFELRLATYTFALLAHLNIRCGPCTARILDLPARLLSQVGCSGGVVQVELFLADGSVRRAGAGGMSEGQRMAALPCVLVAEALNAGKAMTPGAATAYEFLGTQPLLDALVRAGFQVRQFSGNR